MSELVADCPRCGSQKITFDVRAANFIGENYGWQTHWEAFGICRHCSRSTVHVLVQSEHIDAINRLRIGKELLQTVATLNNCFSSSRYVSLSDRDPEPPPDHLPEDIDKAFREGAKCLAIDCPNAAATMFRLCVDLATRKLLPPEGEPSHKVRRDLGLRLPWLFKNGLLPQGLEKLSHCIKEDGNDGAHAGTLIPEDALDLRDFTYELLERLYSDPKKLELAESRREQRRRPKQAD
jgi:hypothetical protein